MHIKEITLFTSTIEKERNFYSQILGFEIKNESDDSFSVQVGQTLLSFIYSVQNYKYHYCFLIPSNKLTEALEWMQGRWNVIELEKDRFIERFENWNANAFYFYDGSGNIVEFIARYNLKNEVNSSFSQNQILNLNEIGVPSNNNALLSNQVKEKMDIEHYSGDQTRFCTSGNEEGLFLFPNYNTKLNWFPTELLTTPCPFEAIITEKANQFQIKYDDEKMEIINLIKK
jgi:catechol 2,3-dioxygenase-like lactoylglutathione lyase family enzyme